MAAICGATAAGADCGYPPAPLGWTYPTDGESGIPTNAKLFFAPRPLEVRINNIFVPEVEPGIFDPGLLEPETTYQVDSTFDAYNGSTPPDVVSFTTTFKTGELSSTLSPSVEAAQIVHVCIPDPLPLDLLSCPVLLDYNCIDDAPIVVARIDPASTAVLAWRVGGTSLNSFASAACDAIVTIAAAGTVPSFQLRAYMPNGNSVAGITVVGVPPSCNADGGVWAPTPNPDAGPFPTDAGSNLLADSGRETDDDAGGGEVPPADAGSGDADGPNCACTTTTPNADSWPLTLVLFATPILLLATRANRPRRRIHRSECLRELANKGSN